MTTDDTARYANWKAPAEDGQTLAWPAGRRLVDDTNANARSLSAAAGCRVQGVPVPELRRQMRAWIGHKDETQPLVATGHQTELYHPGVWVKDALTNAVADRLGGLAWHFAVDTDQPKHLAVRWPGTTRPITDDPALSAAEWSGLLVPPTPAHLSDLDADLSAAAAGWAFQPMLPGVLRTMRHLSLESESLSAAITHAQHALDWDLGLRHHVLLASPLMSAAPYLAFVHHVLARAPAFAEHYNRALAEYRVEAKIDSPTRPMPDLRVTGDKVEVPFWLDDLADGSRRRAAVRRDGDRLSLSAKGDAFALNATTEGHAAADGLGRWLSDRQLRLSPRALTLTTFLRLLVVDQFVHGIGGGRYDQVTDRVLSSFFGIDPPRFAVATATLIFPGAVGQPRVCPPCVAHEGHRLRHGLLGDSKREIVAAIAALPRRSLQRSMAFSNLRSALSAAAIDHPILLDWSDRYRRTQDRDREEQVLFDRELFYAVQPRERLAGMIDAFRRATR